MLQPQRPADEHERIDEPELRHDVAPDALGRRRGEGVDGDAGKVVAQPPHLAVLRTKVVAPLADAVRFVDRDEAQAKLTKHPPEAGASLADEPLGRHVEETHLVGVLTRVYTSWKDVGGSDRPVVIVGAGEGRATHQILLETFGLRGQQLRPDPALSSSKLILEAVATNPAAIGYVSLGAAEKFANRQEIRLLPFHGVPATTENVRARAYPLVRTLTLLTRAYCHLCDDMRAALEPLLAGRDVTLVEIDVDTDPALESRYGELVPVLLLGDAATGTAICHYRLDSARVRAALA